jgi:hypothetical protein
VAETFTPPLLLRFYGTNVLKRRFINRLSTNEKYPHKIKWEQLGGQQT